jgi:WS/DGAT/MGAT family acyltransferase
MQRLSGLDASFLYLETSTQPLHVCSVLELDTSTIPGGYSFERLVHEMGVRIKAIPTFREKLSNTFLNLDHPVWVEDEEFDVHRHVHRIGLPAPGGRIELAEVCGHLAALPLDRRHPLWEMWVIEGLDGSDARKGGRLAVLTKVHHAAVDGVTGANLMSQLCTVEPDAPPPDPVEAATDANPLRIALGGLGRFASRPINLATNVLPSTVSTVVDTVRRAAGGRAMPSPFAAPQTPFNGSITAHRNVAFTQLDLGDVKTVKDHFGVKVNDVVMALVSGVLRRFLIDHDELPESTLVAMVPVSVHDRSDRPGRNQVSGMFSSLHTDIDDAGQRLMAIAEGNTVAKEHSSAIGATLLQDWSQFAGPADRVPAGAQPGGVQRARTTDPAVLPRRRSRGVVSAGSDLPRCGSEHHGHVAQRQAQRRSDLLPGTASRPVGHGRRIRLWNGRIGRRHQGETARTLIRADYQAHPPTMAACWP